MRHTMNHIRFMISPELNVVQDRAHGSAPRWNQAKALNLTWFRGNLNEFPYSLLSNT
jgi:hypothetical protein